MLKWIFIIFIGLAVVGCNNHSNKGYTLSPRENKLLDNFLSEDVQNFSNAKESLIGSSIIMTSLKVEQAAYLENEVAANKMFYGKTLLLNATISRIDDELDEKPGVALEGLNEFMNSMAYFKDGNIDKISSLKKHQSINLVCTSSDEIAGIIVFTECQFPNDYAKQEAQLIKEGIIDYLKGEEPSSPYLAQTSIGIITAARGLPETSACFTTQGSCINELKKFFKQNNRDLIISIIKELKANGVHVSNEYLGLQITEANGND